MLVFLIFWVAAFSVRLAHDQRKGYTYTITGADIQEVIEANQKMREYLRSLQPKAQVPKAQVPKAVLPAPASRRP